MEKTGKITVLVGTNRPGSSSKIVATQFFNELIKNGAEASLLCLEDLPPSFFSSQMYDLRSEEMETIIDTFIRNADKLVFVIPEYNGGFPGILKTFVDVVPQATWKNKKAAMIGVSSGAAGAARAMDQFTNVLHYLKVHVHYQKPKLSKIDQLLEDGVINEKRARTLLEDLALDMMSF